MNKIKMFLIANDSLKNMYYNVINANNNEVIMMKKRGFTLVELLAVIVILALILVIAIPNVMKIINKSKLDAYDRTQQMILNAARIYLTSNATLSSSLITVGSTLPVTLQELVDNKLLSSTIKDSRTGLNISLNNIVSITKTNTGYTYDMIDVSNVDLAFEYTGNVQSFTIPYSGKYKLELWGAQGGGALGGSEIGMPGSNVSGEINLLKDQILYLYVGGRGGDSPYGWIDEYDYSNNNGGYNGGGSGSGSNGPGGGGATDVRIGGQLLTDRVIVAAGGGGNAMDFFENFMEPPYERSNGILGLGSNGSTLRFTPCCGNDNAGGGGGYYGGQSILGDDSYYAYGGTNYIKNDFLNPSTVPFVRYDNGKIKITKINN
jgi:prepilin-type N-terminal cleavage/methylation domain-containing protein